MRTARSGFVAKVRGNLNDRESSETRSRRLTEAPPWGAIQKFSKSQRSKSATPSPTAIRYRRILDSLHTDVI